MVGVATALNPYIGYDKTAEVAKEALADGRGRLGHRPPAGVLEEEQIQEALAELGIEPDGVR